MKKLFLSLMLLVAFYWISLANKTITLSPGWNVVSTPKILSGINFSNGGVGVSFYGLSWSSWNTIIPTVQTIKPLEWFVVNNSTTWDVIMSLIYKTNVNPMETLFQKTLNLWWNLIWITDEIDPLSNINNAVMSVDFTNSASLNLLNWVNTSFVLKNNSSLTHPELWEAYGVFINLAWSIYGGSQDINTYEDPILELTNNSPSQKDILTGWKDTEIMNFSFSTPDEEIIKLYSFIVQLTGLNKNNFSGWILNLYNSWTLLASGVIVTGSDTINMILSSPMNILKNAPLNLQIKLNNISNTVILWDRLQPIIKQFTAKTFINNTIVGADLVATWTEITATSTLNTVTLSKLVAEAGELVKDRDNIFLWAFVITNNSDEALNLNEISLNITGSATDYIKNVKVKLGSPSASPIDLSLVNNKRIETDLGKSIGSQLIVYIYVDTLNLAWIDWKFIQLSLNTPIIENNSDDSRITDITPANLVWAILYGKENILELTQVSLADKTVEKWTAWTNAISFKIKGEDIYGTKIKKITFDAVSSGIVDSDTVINATLYQWTTEIPATVHSGSIVVDEDFIISAGTTATLTLKLDIASNPESTGFRYDLSGAKIIASDMSSDQNQITPSPLLVSWRFITIVSAGEIVSTYEATAANNKYNKDILAGDFKVVAEYSLYSNYEAVNVGSGIVTFSTGVEDSLLDVQLYYGDELVASNPIWANGSTATFTDLNFDTDTTKKALTVKLVSKVIDQDAGAALANTKVTNVTLGDLKGKDSGEDIANAILGAAGKTFNVVPVTIVPAVTSVGTVAGDFTVVASNGVNTTSDGTEAKADLKAITFAIDVNNGGLTYLTVKDDAGTIVGTATSATGSTATINLSTDELSNGGSTEFTVTATVDGSLDTASYNVSLKGITYTTNVDGNNAIFNAEFGAAKTVLTK